MFNSLKFLSSIIVVLLVALPVFGVVDGFWVWQPDPNGVRYVIPKVKGETASEFAARWQKTIKASKIYGKMENAKFLDLSTDPKTFSELPIDRANVAVVLNRPNQMTDKSPYLKTVVSSFEREGVNLLSIPVGLETVLSPKDMGEFRKQLNSFDGQLGVGGDDPHPKTYRQKSTKETSGNISFKRDIEQSAYITEYLANGKGRVFYICGSMQRAAIADGRGFHSDIGKITKIPQRGETAPVMLEVVVKPDSELALAADSTRFQTSNYHHAAVNDQADQRGKKPKTTISAFNVTPDGTRGEIVKSIEFPNNAGFATQFHPEFRGSPEEHRIVQYVATGWKMRGRYAPKEIVACMERSLGSLLTSTAGAAVAP